MAPMMNISEVTRHLHFAWSLPVHGIAMATSDSSLRRVSTVTDLLSFISVARATQPRLIDGISALPQQRGWEVGLLTIDFQPLQTPASPHHPAVHTNTHTHVHTLSLPTPSHHIEQQLLCSYKHTVCAHKRNLPCKQTHTHTLTDQTSASASVHCLQTHALTSNACVCAHSAQVHT